MGPSRILVALAIAISELAIPGGASSEAVDPAPRDTPAAVSEQILWASRQFRKFAIPLKLPGPIATKLMACEGAAKSLDACTVSPLENCALALAEAFTAAARLRDSEAPASDRASGARLATECAEAMHLLHTAETSFAQGHCESLIDKGTIPARVRLLGDGRTLRLQPILPLRMGRRYALEVIGATTEEKIAASETTFPRANREEIDLPRGTFALPLVQSLPSGESAPLDRIAATNLLRRVEETIRSSDTTAAPTVAGFQVQWPRSMESSDFRELRFRFTPQKKSQPEATLLEFPTRDDRRALQKIREKLRARTCVPVQLEMVADQAEPGLPDGELYQGTIRSLRADPLNPEFTPAPKVTFRLALPRGFHAETPLVLIVHGHGGSSERALRKHRDDLLGRGMAALAIDLPDHGRRGGNGDRFFDPTDPAGLANHLRQSAIDVIAVVDAVQRCGFRQPNTWEWKPREVLYLGYSVGAMVGLIARSVEPEIGTTALLAAGGDLPGWMMLHAPHQFHPKLLSCIGGPDSGADCLGDTAACEPPGLCGVDPFRFQLGEQFALPFAWAAAGGEPLAFAIQRTGPANSADVLIFTGGNDYTLHPLLATRLGDALGLRIVGPHLRRGPGGLRVQRPELGHDLREDPLVRQETASFLSSRGRQRPWIPFP